jgi:hypothetical protein
MLSRVSDDLREDNRHLLPIDGYQNVRLVSLEEAVQPLVSLFPGDSLLSRVWLLKERCREPADGLSQDESASIMLYTVNWPNQVDSLYFILNRTLRLEDRNNLKPWFPYLRLFIGALLQLPPINDTIHRGVKEDLSGYYLPNTNSIWWSFSSCTDTIHVLESDEFCGRIGVRTMFHIKCLGGRSVKNHSFYHSENEILLLPGRYLQVRGHYSAADGLHIIDLEEKQPPYELLKLPDDKPWRRIFPGISLVGKCTNSNCDAYQKEVIVPIGLRKFDVLTETNSDTSKCPICARYVDPLKLGFCECRWRVVQGIKQTSSKEAPTSFSKDWSNAHAYSLLEYNSETGIIWRQLIVEAKPENSG